MARYALQPKGGTIMKQSEYTMKMTVSCPRNDSDMDIEVTGRYVDEGIGAYEYWGAKGHDTRWVLEWELTSCPIPDEEVYENQKLCDVIEENFAEYINRVTGDNHAD